MELKQVGNDQNNATYSQSIIYHPELNTDFEHPTPFSITFDTTSASGAEVCVDIPTIDDTVLEGDQGFTISLSSSNLVGNVQLSTDSVTAVIEDNNSELEHLVLCDS